MAVSRLARLAARFAAADRTPVFGVAGPGARDRLEDLGLHPDVDLVATPRHATILLVAGRIPDEHLEALARVHDQVPHPRATLWWGPRSGGHDDGVDVGEGADPAEPIRALHRDLLVRDRPSEAGWLADEPPHPWRGRGDHGQGGEGMMGGVPYGRPMAMTADDVRDGLALDRLSFTIGPFAAGFPPGLEIEIALQGDAVQEVEVVSEPYPQPCSAAGARRELRRLHRALRAAGAPSLAERVLRRAIGDEPSLEDVAALRRRLQRTGFGTRLSALPQPRGGGGEGGDASAADALRRLEETLPGMEWGRAVAMIAALDPAPREPKVEGTG